MSDKPKVIIKTDKNGKLRDGKGKFTTLSPKPPPKPQAP